MSDTNTQTYDFRQFDIQSIALIAMDGSAIDIRGLVTEIILRQDISVGYMSGEMLLSDATDLPYNYSITGGEYLHLNLTSPSNDKTVNKAFRIFKVSERRPAKTNNSQQYRIHFVSEEMYLSNLLRVTKAYRGTTLSTVAKDIMTTYLKASKYTIDETDISQDLIIPNKRPTEAINWLASRATNGSDYCWMYYENLDGLQFRCLNKLFNEKSVNSQPFMRQVVSLEKKLDESYFIIDDYEIKRDFDLLTLSRNGGVAIHFTGVDPIKRTWKDTLTSQNDIPKMYDIPNVPNVTLPNGKSVNEQYEAYTLTYIQNDTTNSDVWHKRVLSLAALYNNLMEVVIPGNLDVQAGNMVDLMFYSMLPQTESNMVNETATGRYFVISVTHKFSPMTSQFDTIFAVSRDSLHDLAVGADSSLMDKVGKLNG